MKMGPIIIIIIITIIIIIMTTFSIPVRNRMCNSGFALAVRDG